MGIYKIREKITQLDKNIAKKKIPFQVLLELTYRCNLRCLHCYCVDEAGRQELSLSEIERVLKELAALGCLQVTFSGGETFMREDFFDILGIARKLHYLIFIFTNGVAVDEAAAERIAGFAPLGVEVSLYGATAETHEKITRVKGSFQRTLRAIKLLKMRNVDVTVKWPLLKDTFSHYHKLIELAKSLHVEYRADPLIFPRNDRDPAPLAQRLSDDELCLAYQYLGTSVIKEEPARLSAMQKPVCGAGHDNCCVSPYGDVYPCVQFFLKFGNVRENSFHDIWYHSQAVRDYRKINTYADIPDCRACSMVADCVRCPGLADLEDGSYLGKSQESCRLTRAVIQARKQLYKGGS
ncbi:MAG: hypothetical protein AMJ95_11980 [Omnitrophica WOR_2 bacterium SM23_72]|nr:MAG: hypothetical protein AMJ95_11980 [Omnitrophica WOR_2 bacterium SM23_72]